MTTTPTENSRVRQLLLDNLFAVFGEHDPERRMQAIVANYTEDVIWTSPETTTRGHEELSAGAQNLIDRTPTFVFTAAGPVHVVGDLGYLAFIYGVPRAGPRFHWLRRGPDTRWTNRRVVHAAQRIH